MNRQFDPCRKILPHNYPSNAQATVRHSAESSDSAHAAGDESRVGNPAFAFGDDSTFDVGESSVRHAAAPWAIPHGVPQPPSLATPHAQNVYSLAQMPPYPYAPHPVGVWQYATTSPVVYHPPQPHDVSLEFRQQPLTACVVRSQAPKSGKPVSPAPIIALNVRHEADPSQLFRCNPFLFMYATLCAPDGSAVTKKTSGGAPLLGGTCVSSAHTLKDLNDNEGTFFVFGDLMLRETGRFRLNFSLFEVRDGATVMLGAQLSDPFEAQSKSDFVDLHDSDLSAAFAGQGVKHLPLPRRTKRKRAAADTRQVAAKRTQTAPFFEAPYYMPSDAAGASAAVPHNVYAQQPNYSGATWPPRHHGFAPNAG